MPFAVIDHYRAKVRQMGLWAGIRYMRNRGLPLEATYFILFNRAPKKPF